MAEKKVVWLRETIGSPFGFHLSILLQSYLNLEFSCLCVILFENGTGVVIMEKSLKVFCVGVINQKCVHTVLQLANIRQENITLQLA